MSSIPTVTPAQLSALIEAGEQIILVDVRTDEEYEAIHAKGAIHIPLSDFSWDELKRRIREHGYPDNEPIYILCQHGHRASRACEQALREGGDRVHVVSGGSVAWAQEGLPLVQGRSPHGD
jgi:rhodanese-related sulfurtransferase